jgi:hypothetical protein
LGVSAPVYMKIAPAHIVDIDEDDVRLRPNFRAQKTNRSAYQKRTTPLEKRASLGS